MNKGIFFDLDGTLWNSSKGTLKAANEVLKNNDVKTISKETIDSCMGLTRAECAKIYIEEVAGKKRMEIYDEVQDNIIDYLYDKGASLYPGVKKTLETLKNDGYVLGIVTNSAEMKYVLDFFHQFEIGSFFDGFIAAGAYNLTKKQAIKKLKNDLHVDEIIYVGDTSIDADASKNVCPFVFCKYGFGDVENPDYSIDEFKDLVDLVKKIYEEN